MRVAGSQSLLGWTLATMIVLTAVFGPPLTGQSVHAFIELRHEVLMIDREFERWTIRTDTSSEEQEAQARGGIP